MILPDQEDRSPRFSDMHMNAVRDDIAAMIAASEPRPDFGDMPPLSTEELQSGSLVAQFNTDDGRAAALRRAEEWSTRR